MELETLFYVVGIIFMGLMIVMIATLVTAVLVIKSKINKLHDSVGERVDQVKAVGSKIGAGLMLVKAILRR